jgi:hypothetical protein
MPYPRVVEDPVADRNQLLQGLLALLWVVAVSAMKHPRGPLVEFAVDAHVAQSPNRVGRRGRLGSSDMHPNEALLRREYEARAAGDDSGIADGLADDVVWHVPGRSVIAGDYRGRDQVMGYVRKRRELAAARSRSQCMTFGER